MKAKSPAMVGVIWRVSAPNFDVDAFLQEFKLKPDVVWRPGEVFGKRCMDKAGFNLSIDQEDTYEGMIKDVWRFVKKYRKAFLALHVRSVSCYIDFGFQVGSPTRFVRTLIFSPDDLAMFVELGITLEVTGYPSS
jgi:hypothetical protein